MDANVSWSSMRGLPGETIWRLDGGWRLHLTEAAELSTPADLSQGRDFVDAPVPGTVAEALENAGQFDRANPQPLDGKDAWYFLDLNAGKGHAVLRLEGLATVADVFLNDELILQSRSMFVAHDVDVSLIGGDELAICFRAMGPELAKKGPRARWRPQMITPAGVRNVRTTALGRMPGWCPEVHAVGPWRPISLVRREAGAISNAEISTALDSDGTGHLRVRLKGDTSDAILQCAGRTATFVAGEANIAIADVEPWWPHTHGCPVLHNVKLVRDGETYDLAQVGFRRVELDRGSDGNDFALKINGVPVFCRGAVWTTPDIVRLPGGEVDYRPWLERAAEAGMNMIRIGGTMAYESPEFFKLCDALGLMVWQEAMLANFDYPVKDEAWLALFNAEIAQLLTSTSASPSLVVFCGGSEVYQQAAMLGLPKDKYESELTEEILPAIVKTLRPDCIYVPNSPSGGAMPFAPNAGVTHYYGVGAYCRPLEDARRANVRFAAESLAFAHVPEQATLEKFLPVSPVHDPRWKARVPRDRGASWDFEDIREHYLKELYSVDPETLRRENPALYLDLSRAVTGEVIEATYAEWRRPGSSCNGAMIWNFQDLLPGAGWGLIDSTGLPKPVWHAVRRAFRPVQITLTDEGTNGVDVHILNELDMGMEVVAELNCLRDGKVPVVMGERAIRLAPHTGQTIAATDFFGAFFDTSYAFRFGPPSHDAVVARLIDAATGEELASAFHFPQGRSAARHVCELKVSLVEDIGWQLVVSADRLAQNVIIDVPGFLPSDNWFHLSPCQERVISLQPIDASVERPSGEVRLAGGAAAVRF